MNRNNLSNGVESRENSTTARLVAVINELESCLRNSAGKNALWENRVSSKITALKIAMQTLNEHNNLPKGMTLQELENSARELIGQKP